MSSSARIRSSGEPRRARARRAGRSRPAPATSTGAIVTGTARRRGRRPRAGPIVPGRPRTARRRRRAPAAASTRAGPVDLLVADDVDVGHGLQGAGAGRGGHGEDERAGVGRGLGEQAAGRVDGQRGGRTAMRGRAALPAGQAPTWRRPARAAGAVVLGDDRGGARDDRRRRRPGRRRTRPCRPGRRGRPTAAGVGGAAVGRAIMLASTHGRSGAAGSVEAGRRGGAIRPAGDRRRRHRSPRGRRRATASACGAP